MPSVTQLIRSLERAEAAAKRRRKKKTTKKKASKKKASKKKASKKKASKKRVSKKKVSGKTYKTVPRARWTKTHKAQWAADMQRARKRARR